MNWNYVFPLSLLLCARTSVCVCVVSLWAVTDEREREREILCVGKQGGEHGGASTLTDACYIWRKRPQTHSEYFWLHGIPNKGKFYEFFSATNAGIFLMCPRTSILSLLSPHLWREKQRGRKTVLVPLEEIKDSSFVVECVFLSHFAIVHKSLRF